MHLPKLFSAGSLLEFCFYVVAFFSIWLVSQNILFWDTVQFAGKHSLFFYENYGKAWLLPDDIDSGHIPFFGFYLATIFKVFGVSLAVAHWSMLPFLFGIICFVFRFAETFDLSKSDRFVLAILLLSDPTLLAQSILVSPDIMLMCFFTIALYGILSKHNFWRWFGILGLSIVSLRGAMAVFVLFSMEIFSSKPKIKDIYHLIMPYLISGLLVFTYILVHYFVKGWIGFHSNSPWAGSFALNSISAWPKHIILLIWRLIDFGRIGMWIVLFIVLIHARKKLSVLKTIEFKGMIVITIGLLIVLGLNFVIYKGVNAHRYLLPLYFSTSLIFFLIVKAVMGHKYKSLIWIVCISLWSGHFWIYPDHVSQGWDSSLAHVPYYSLRSNMIDYLEKHSISISDVGCQFPNIAESRFITLIENEKTHFKACEIDTDKYVLYSNVFNDFTDVDREKLQENFNIIFGVQKNGVRLELYERNH